MNKLSLEDQKFGVLDGLNSTLDIIHDAYKNSELIMPYSPQSRVIENPKIIETESPLEINSKNDSEQDENINNNKNNKTQNENENVHKSNSVYSGSNSKNPKSVQLGNHWKPRMSQQLAGVKLGFIEHAFGEALKSTKVPVNTIGLVSSVLGISHSKSRKFDQYTPDSLSPQAQNQTTKRDAQKSTYNHHSHHQNESTPQENSILADSENEEKGGEDNAANRRKMFAQEMLEQIRENNRRFQMRQDMLRRLGIGKQNEEKFKSFLQKNAQKIQPAVEADNQISQQKNKLTRSLSIDKDRMLRFGHIDIVEKILSKEQVHLSNSEDAMVVINILKKQQQRATKVEKQFINRSLQNINLFQTHKNEVFNNTQTNEKLFESLGYKFFRKHEVIFNLGDKGDTYYIVLRGSAVLLLPKSLEDAEFLERQAEKRQIEQGKNNYLLQEPLQLMNEEIEDPASDRVILTPIKKEPLMRLVKVKESKIPVTLQLEPDSGLLQPGQIRQASNQSFIRDKRPSKLDINSKRNLKRLTDFLDYRTSTPQPRPSSINSQLTLFSPARKPGTSIFKASNNNNNILQKVPPLSQKDRASDIHHFCCLNFPNMKIIKEFLPGEAFGEIALLTQQTRTGTMVCKEDTHLMTLTKEGFDKIIGQYNIIIISEKIRFLRQFEFLRHIPQSKLMILLHETKIQFYSKGQIVYSENDPLKYLYLIKEGEVAITEYVDLDQSHDTNESNINTLNSDEKALLHHSCLKSRGIQQRQTGKRVQVYQQGSPSFFGEYELLRKDISVRAQRVECTSLECTIYAINKEILFQFMKKFGGLPILQSESNDKREWQKTRIEECKQRKTEKILEQIDSREQRHKRKKQVHESIFHKKRMYHSQQKNIPGEDQQGKGQSQIIDNINDSKQDQQQQTCSLSDNDQNQTSKGVSIKKYYQEPKQTANNQLQSTDETSILNTKTQQDQLNKTDQQIPHDNKIRKSVLVKKLSAMKIFTSCVGAKPLDEAITKAFLFPSQNWQNQAYISLDKFKKSPTLLDVKLESSKKITDQQPTSNLSISIPDNGPISPTAKQCQKPAAELIQQQLQTSVDSNSQGPAYLFLGDPPSTPPNRQKLISLQNASMFSIQNENNKEQMQLQIQKDKIHNSLSNISRVNNNSNSSSNIRVSTLKRNPVNLSTYRDQRRIISPMKLSQSTTSFSNQTQNTQRGGLSYNLLNSSKDFLMPQKNQFNPSMSSRMLVETPTIQQITSSSFSERNRNIMYQLSSSKHLDNASSKFRIKKMINSLPQVNDKDPKNSTAISFKPFDMIHYDPSKSLQTLSQRSLQDQSVSGYNNDKASMIHYQEEQISRTQQQDSLGISFGTTIRSEKHLEDQQQSLIPSTIDNSLLQSASMPQFKTTKQIQQDLQMETQIKKQILNQIIFDKKKLPKSPTHFNSAMVGSQDMLILSNEESKNFQRAIQSTLFNKHRKVEEAPKNQRFNTVHIDLIQKLKIVP